MCSNLRSIIRGVEFAIHTYMLDLKIYTDLGYDSKLVKNLHLLRHSEAPMVLRVKTERTKFSEIHKLISTVSHSSRFVRTLT